MADNYTQFSEMILTAVDEEKDFISLGLTSIDDLALRLSREAKSAGTYSVDENHDYVANARRLYAAELGHVAFDALEHQFGQLHEIQDDGVWVYTNDEDSLELTVAVVSAWQIKFDIQEPWYLTWSAVCSQPRVGEFGGGAVVVYKGICHWQGTRYWACEAIKLLTAEGGNHEDNIVLTTKAPEVEAGSGDGEGHR